MNEISSHQGLLTNRPVQGFPGHLIGQFIWDKEGSDQFLVLRKRFEIARLPETAMLHVTAAQKYQLFVNGERMGHGPCRSVHPSWIRYDSYDLAGCLRPGANSFVVLAYDHGRPFYFSPHSFKGVFVQAELFDGKNCTVVGTDDTWRVKRPDRFRRDTQLMNFYTDLHAEMVEADNDSGGWIETDFDDDAWPQAAVRPAGPRYDSGATDFVHCLEPRPTPPLHEHPLRPAAVVRVGELDNAPAAQYGELDVAARLWHAGYSPLRQASILNVGNLLEEKSDGAVFQSHLDKDGLARDPFVILDFDSTAIGVPELTFDAPSGTVVEIAYAERLEDGRVPFHDPTRPAWGPWKHADRYVARDGVQTWRLFEPRTATRYVQVVFRTGGKTARLIAARLIAYEYPVEERGRFECSDPTLTRLWRAAVDTVHLAMEDVLSCDSVRERSYYIMGGELEQHHLAMYVAYGDVAITDTHFTDTPRNLGADGSMPIAMIARANGIKNYALFYPVAVWRRHLHFAKPGFLEAQYAAVASIMGWFERQGDADGLLYSLPHSVWLDWADVEPRGANLEVNALYYNALRHAADIADCVVRPDDARRWRTLAENVKNALRCQHWDEEIGCFRDSVIDGCQARQITETSNAMVLLFGIASPEQATRVVEHLVEWSRIPLVNDPKSPGKTRAYASPLDNGTVISRTSPLYFFYVVDALTQAGRDSDAWTYLAANYRRVFQGSDTRFLPESWPRDTTGHDTASHSASIHGGGAGVAFLLSRDVLGVRPAAPGFARCRIQPRLGTLAWAKGIVPTPRGDVGVSWKRTPSGGLRFEVETPGDMSAELVLPRQPGQVELILNGHVVVDDVPAVGTNLQIDNASICVPLPGGVNKGELRITCVHAAGL
jgi:alpha-L-rhamnosidase